MTTTAATAEEIKLLAKLAKRLHLKRLKVGEIEIELWEASLPGAPRGKNALKASERLLPNVNLSKMPTEDDFTFWSAGNGGDTPWGPSLPETDAVAPSSVENG